ncbi:MAG: hypothetical protein KC516_00875 [Nanoarchaeota archaeon]|nr:hypothetical protein [Nanoarchaeota archaeon]
MKIPIFLILFLFLSFASSANLSISPDELKFNGKIGETLCQEMVIRVTNETLLGEDLWAEEGYFERNLKAHTLNSSEFETKLIYPKETYVESEKKIEICLIGEKPGNFHGVLFYKIKEKPLRVGIWISASLSEEKSFTIGESISEKRNVKGLNYLLPMTIVLVGALIILLFKKR